LVHIDETGHKEEGRNPWTWCFGNARMALFAIRDSRGSQVVEEMLGAAFEGLAVHDFYSAYIKYDASNRQFCLAHLVRDVKFLGTLTDRRERRWGAKVLEDFKELFALYHRRDELTARAYVRKAKALKHRIRKRTWNASALPSNARNLAKRIRTHFEDIFRFLEDAQAPPTNNLAERLLRPVVIDRRITQGTRGARGRRWCERIWTTLATCRLQGRSAWQFLRDAIESFYASAASPSLLPA
jgi:transposase